MKALQRFNQNLASDEYQRAWTRHGTEQDRQGRALSGLGATGAGAAGSIASLWKQFGSDQANLTMDEAASRAALIQSFFGASANQALDQGRLGMGTIGNLTNIGQGLIGSFGGGNNLSLAGSASSPFSGASYDNSIWTGAQPKF
jgi:hypothetical protein